MPYKHLERLEDESLTANPFWGKELRIEEDPMQTQPTFVAAGTWAEAAVVLEAVAGMEAVAVVAEEVVLAAVAATSDIISVGVIF